MFSRALDFVCYHAFIRIPSRWVFTKAAMALLPRAGSYAYRGEAAEQEVPDGGR